MIHDFVFKNANHPGAFGTSTLEIAAASQCGEKCFLYQIFRRRSITNACQSEAEEQTAMSFYPVIRI
jgi:hypothetical protein